MRPITIYCGDYFELTAPPCDALYDRAALVALPPSRRGAYAAHTDTLLHADADRLVISFEYDQSLVDGPPFSVTGDEVLGDWPGLVAVERREVLDEAPPKFRRWRRRVRRLGASRGGSGPETSERAAGG